MKHIYRIDADFEMIGIWTLPGYSLSNGITGKLIYDNNQLKLEVYGDFNDVKKNKGIQFFGSEIEEEDFIIGFSQNGYSVIIENAYRVKYNSSSPGMTYSEYRTNKCLLMQINYVQYDYTVEELFNKLIERGLDNIDCTSCNFSLRGMNEWMNSTVIKREFKNKTAYIYYDLSEGDYDRYIIHDKNLIYSNDIFCSNGANNSLVEEHFWKLESENGTNLSLNELKYNIDLFKNLIQLFIDSPTEFSFIDFEIAIEGKIRKTIQAHYIYLQPKFNDKLNVSIYYTDIKDQFKKILTSWFENNNKLTLIVDNYLNDINTNYFSESKLLNSIKNLEIYHRNFVDNTKYIPVNENLERYKKDLIEYIENTVDEDEYKQRFKRNIEYSPEITLNKRITELFKSMDVKTKEEFWKLPKKSLNKSISSIVYSLVETRNYYTHGDDISNYSKSITDTVGQVNMTSLLNQTIKYFIYYELDMLNDDIIEKVIKGRKEYV